jgi:hypothetical protein
MPKEFFRCRDISEGMPPAGQIRIEVDGGFVIPTKLVVEATHVLPLAGKTPYSRLELDGDSDNLQKSR